MNRETYLEMMRGVLDLDAEATHQDITNAAIRRMEADGFTVTLDRMTDHRFRGRVRRNSSFSRKVRTSYNVHTTSTSGYPVLGAFEKYLAWKEGESWPRPPVKPCAGMAPGVRMPGSMRS